MAATNTTSNLELSQFVGTDKPDWLTDYNSDMLKIDSAYGAVNALAEQAAANAQAAATSAAAASEDASAALSGISGAIEAAQAATTAAEQATTVSNNALTIANGAAATAQGAAGDATQALSIAQNAKTTAENAQAAAAQAATDAAAAATSAAGAASDAQAAAAIASGVDSRVSAIEACVPATASASNQFATVEDIPAVGSKKISGTSKSDYFDYIGTYDSTTNLSNLLDAIHAVLSANLDKITENTKIYLGSMASAVQYDGFVFRLDRWIAGSNDGVISDLYFKAELYRMGGMITLYKANMYFNMATANSDAIYLTKNWYTSYSGNQYSGGSLATIVLKNSPGTTENFCADGFAINWE